MPRKSKRDPNKKYVHISTFLTEEATEMLGIALASTHKKHGSKENLLSHVIVEYFSNPEKWKKERINKKEKKS